MVVDDLSRRETDRPSRLVLCADDYGMSLGVCDAIEALVSDCRLSAVSVMTVFPEWRQRALRLRQVVGKEQADVGLHLTLTDHKPLSSVKYLAKTGQFPSLSQILRVALLRRLPVAEIQQEVRAQLDAFEDAYGQPPAFVDGHQHVHVFPVIRQVVLTEVVQRYGHSCWVRSTVEAAGPILRRRVASFKAMVLAGLGWQQSRMAQRLGVPQNDSFRGAYDFATPTPYASLFPSFMADHAGRPRCPLIFCHPGQVDDVLRRRSSLADVRAVEYVYLSSPQFAVDCRNAGYIVGRF